MLTFIEFCGSSADKHRLASFKCDCGSITVTAYSRVKNGYTRSCGCLIRKKKRNLKHGQHGTRTYASWLSAKSRATKPADKDFRRYGAVGIGFAERWMQFENFYADMGDRPHGTSLDRIDGTRGYEPGNCRWATPQQQARNRVDFTVLITPIGEMPLVDYAARIGISVGAAHMRLKRNKLEGCRNATGN